MTDEIQKLHNRINELIKREDTKQKINTSIHNEINTRIFKLINKFEHEIDNVRAVYNQITKSLGNEIDKLKFHKNMQIDENQKICARLDELADFVGLWRHDEDCAINENKDCDCIEQDARIEEVTKCDSVTKLDESTNECTGHKWKRIGTTENKICLRCGWIIKDLTYLKVSTEKAVSYDPSLSVVLFDINEKQPDINDLVIAWVRHDILNCGYYMQLIYTGTGSDHPNKNFTFIDGLLLKNISAYVTNWFKLDAPKGQAYVVRGETK